MVKILDYKGSLETERLIHRPFEISDTPRLIEIRTTPNVNRFVGGAIVNTPEWLTNRVKSYIEFYNTHGYGMYALIWKETGEIIGWSGLQEFGESGDIEVGYGMIEKYWGRGIAFETASFWFDFAFDEAKLDKLVGVAEKSNIASNRVLKKIGLKLNGERSYFGMDCNYYSLKRCELETNKQNPQ